MAIRSPRLVHGGSNIGSLVESNIIDNGSNLVMSNINDVGFSSNSSNRSNITDIGSSNAGSNVVTPDSISLDPISQISQISDPASLDPTSLISDISDTADLPGRARQWPAMAWRSSSGGGIGFAAKLVPFFEFQNGGCRAGGMGLCLGMKNEPAPRLSA